ncbi:predicted protein [Chaetoceros tenuissimus]|uniref:Uncharacterized protein n=1 Tax=Chaetoceros tenuissimus TaxID=426638 RepID=A0AAD3CFW7_9STRA|nr:predicted protein [Chaetoceros tenuissimus]
MGRLQEQEWLEVEQQEKLCIAVENELTRLEQERIQLEAQAEALELCVQFIGTKLLATRDIKKGEELFACYGLSEEKVKELRKNYVKSNWRVVESLVGDGYRPSIDELKEICELFGIEKEVYADKRKKAIWMEIKKKLDGIE